MKSTHIVGACHYDHSLFCKEHFILGSSNPAETIQIPGGVGHNIAKNLVALGDEISFSHWHGDDDAGKTIAHYVQGINFRRCTSILKENTSSPSYTAVHYSDGELLGGFADMSLYDDLKANDTEVLSFEEDILVFDCNLSKDAFAAIMETIDLPFLACAAVSPAKVQRLLPYLSKLDLVILNSAELMALTNAFGEHEYADGLKWLKSKGVKNAIVTMGHAGSYGYDANTPFFSPAAEIDEAVSVNGCGDAFFAGVIWGLSHNTSLLDASRYGHAMAAFTIKSPNAVHDNMSESALLSMLSSVPSPNRLSWRGFL